MRRPAFDFILRSVDVCVRGRMPRGAIAFDVEKGGTLPLTSSRALALDRVGDRQRVDSVDRFRVHRLTLTAAAMRESRSQPMVSPTV